MRTMSRYASTVLAPPMRSTLTPEGELYAAAFAGRVARSASTSHGAVTARRAALTVQLCRASSSPRVLASSLRNWAQRAQQAAHVGPAYVASDAERLDDAVGTGSASLALSASRQSPKRPDALKSSAKAVKGSRSCSGPRSPS